MKVRKLKTRIAAFGLAVLMGISTLSSANAFAAEQTGSEQQTEVQASEQAVTNQKDTSVTADDITKPLLCEYFGGKMIMNEDVLKHITYLFEVKMKRPMIERNRKQAEVPDVCTVLFNYRNNLTRYDYFPR